LDAKFIANATCLVARAYSALDRVAFPLVKQPEDLPEARRLAGKAIDAIFKASGQLSSGPARGWSDPHLGEFARMAANGMEDEVPYLTSLQQSATVNDFYSVYMAVVDNPVRGWEVGELIGALPAEAQSDQDFCLFLPGGLVLP